MGWMTKEFWFLAGTKVLPFFITYTPAMELTHSLIQWVPGAVSPGVKWQGPEADHTPPSSVEVKNVATISPLLHTSAWHSA
jgi:hypothetical protein